MTLLFLDVDGPLIPFRARPSDRPSAPPSNTGNPLLDRLNPADGRRLLGLNAELVWATTWESEANEVIAPRLGLPQLPVVAWPDDDEASPRGVHWKTAPLTRWANGRPFIWLDDEMTDPDRRWVATHHPAPALLHRVDAFTGLTDADFTALHQWLTANRTN